MIPSIVNGVSAMFVNTTTFLPAGPSGSLTAGAASKDPLLLLRREVRVGKERVDGAWVLVHQVVDGHGRASILGSIPYTEKDLMGELEEQTYPEILGSSLSNTVSELVKLGIKLRRVFFVGVAPLMETLFL